MMDQLIAAFMGEDQVPQQSAIPPRKPPPQMGPPAPADYGTPGMPEAYQNNRMKEMGMPGIAQIGEAMFDSYRANKWKKQHAQEVDEMGGSIGGNSEKLPHTNKSGSKAIGSGIFDGGDLFSQVGQAIMRNMGGMA